MKINFTKWLTLTVSLSFFGIMSAYFINNQELQNEAWTKKNKTLICISKNLLNINKPRADTRL